MCIVWCVVWQSGSCVSYVSDIVIHLIWRNQSSVVITYCGFICSSGNIIQSFSGLFIYSRSQAVSRFIYVCLGLHRNGETKRTLIEEFSSLLIRFHTILVAFMYLEPCDEVMWSWSFMCWCSVKKLLAHFFIISHRFSTGFLSRMLPRSGSLAWRKQDAVDVTLFVNESSHQTWSTNTIS